MRDTHYYINQVDSIDRCPCAKCGGLPVVAKMGTGTWVTFCPTCDLDRGFDGMNPLWFAGDKDRAIFVWSARQLIFDICAKSGAEA